jgi:hypothetical protein
MGALVKGRKFNNFIVCKTLPHASKREAPGSHEEVIKFSFLRDT